VSDDEAAGLSEEPAEGSEGEGAPPPEPEPPQPEDIDTDKHDLRKLAIKASAHRRRTTLAELSVKRPKKKEVRLGLDRSTTTIGRDPACDIVVDDDGVSRRHARVVKNDQGYFELIDLSSTNGTLVNEAPVSRMLLLDGDRFVVGDTRFTIHVAEEELA
jgi:pSer/pThr/pTyr-binding forkhead associated (FHA) protein